MQQYKLLIGKPLNCAARWSFAEMPWWKGFTSTFYFCLWNCTCYSFSLPEHIETPSGTEYFFGPRLHCSVTLGMLSTIIVRIYRSLYCWICFEKKNTFRERTEDMSFSMDAQNTKTEVCGQDKAAAEKTLRQGWLEARFDIPKGNYKIFIKLQLEKTAAFVFLNQCHRAGRGGAEPISLIQGLRSFVGVHYQKKLTIVRLKRGGSGQSW